MSTEDDSPCGSVLSEGLGPIATLVACLRDDSGRHINGLYDKRAADELERLAELADSEGTRAVNYLRRARKAEKLLREVLEALPGLQAPNCLGMDLYQRVGAALGPNASLSGGRRPSA